ncbi:MAG: asparagine synthase (glutamine-hydrolyzing) [bacterium]|nr:asparagine synthase (glutamine-hydrolyzing) [bacterium]
MCGIAGIVSTNPTDMEATASVRRMMAALAHRGPDDEGLVQSSHEGEGAPSAILGHRRLSIIDLSSAARQPLPNEDETVWMICNGEIYNFLELRADLEKRGHRFRSDVDSEVLVHLYEEEGPALVERLRGMFAFAIWDAPEGRLVLARDRVGKKPLLFAETPSGLAFASSLPALLEEPSLDRELLPEALHHYLTYGCVPSPLSIFAGAQKLPPAHVLVWERGRWKTHRYWELACEPKRRMSEMAWMEATLESLTEATRIRLMSDVPLGAFLSGGLDSSAVVGLMSKALDEPVRTFSIGFNDPSYNELPYARRVAEQYGTEHREFVVEPEAIEMLPTLVRHYGEPYADSSALPCFYLARMTREHVTVVLNGDGGDEAFGGYERYFALLQSAKYRRLPGPFRTHVLEPMVRAWSAGSHARGFAAKLARFLESASAYDDPARRYGRWLSYFSDRDKAEGLYTDDFNTAVGENDSYKLLADLFDKARGWDLVDQAIFSDVGLYLPEDLLVKMDVATMAYALEARSPFLDHHVMELAAQMPASLKVKGRTTKVLLKRLLANELPPDLIHRPKAGFGIPIDAWFRKELGTYAREVVLDSESLQRGYFRRSSLEGLFDEHASGRANHGFKLWTLLMLELWHRWVPTVPTGALV